MYWSPIGLIALGVVAVAEQSCKQETGEGPEVGHAMLQVKESIIQRHTEESPCQQCVHVNCKEEMDQCADTNECNAYEQCAEAAKLECTEECGTSTASSGSCRRRYACNSMMQVNVLDAGNTTTNESEKVGGLVSANSTANESEDLGGSCEACIHANCQAEMDHCADTNECDEYTACSEVARVECTEECGGIVSSGGCRRRYACQSMIAVEHTESEDTTADESEDVGGSCEKCVHANCQAEMDHCVDTNECDEYTACSQVAELECSVECGDSTVSSNPGTCRRRYTC